MTRVIMTESLGVGRHRDAEARVVVVAPLARRAAVLLFVLLAALRPIVAVFAVFLLVLLARLRPRLVIAARGHARARCRRPCCQRGFVVRAQLLAQARQLGAEEIG